MHQWGDREVDWPGISDAAEYIATYLRRWGRIDVTDYKEKYGTVRVYLYFGWHQFHSITHPGYAYSQYPKWLWELDCRYISRIIEPFNWLIVPYHKYLYKKAYRNAIAKWPHLREEILSGADYSELLGEFGVHRVRTGALSYDILIDWHLKNWRANHPPEQEQEIDLDIEEGPIRIIKKAKKD